MPTASSPFAREIRALLPIALPLAAANLSQMLMALTNSIIVGHLGAHALSAVGAGGGLNFTVTIICLGVLYAVAPLAANAIGSGDGRAAGHVAAAGLLIAAAMAPLIFAILSLVGLALLAIGYEASLAHDIDLYLHATRWGVPGVLAFGVLRSLLAASRRAGLVMAILAVAVPANAVLSWAPVFGHFGIAGRGIAGSGWATAIIQSAMGLALLAIIWLAPRGTPVRLSRKVARQVAAILRLGLPIGGTIALETGMFATTGILMGLFGTHALAAHQLVLNFGGLSFMVPLGIGQAATVRVGHELGAGAPNAARRAAFVALTLGIGFMAMMALLMWTAPRLLIAVYVNLDDPANARLVAIAVQMLTIAAIFQVCDGMQTIAAAGLRGYRDTAVPMLLAGIGYWVIGFCGGYVLAFPLGRGPIGLWWGLALGLAAVAALLTARLATRARAAVRTSAAAAVTDRIAAQA